MGLIRLLLEFDVLAALFLLEEIAIPYLRDRRMFPASRWALGKLRARVARIASRTPTEELLDSALSRQRDAQARLDAATRDLEAARLERKAAEIESATNHLREENPPS